jgi:MFS family permease
MKNNTGKYKWILVALLFGVALLNYMDRQMIATMRPAMQADIPALQQATNFGHLMAVFLWVYGSMSFFSGMIADRINRKRLIVASLFIWSAVTLAMGYAHTFEQLYWLRAFMGFSEALYIPAGLAMIADHHDDRTRSLAVGLHMTGIYMGQAFGGFGSVISNMMSWQNTFIMFGLIGIAYAVVLLLALKDDSKTGIHSTKEKQASQPIRESLSLFGNFSFWIIILYFAAPSFPGWAIKNWAPTLVAQNLNIDMAKAGPLTTISISCASLIGVLVGGRMSDKWVINNIRGRIYTGAIGLALTIPALLLIGFGHSFFFILLAAVLFGFGFGMFDTNNMPILCQFVPERMRATAYGFLNTAGIFAGALITDLLGKSTDEGSLGKHFAMLALVVLGVIIIQLRFLRPQNTN